MAVDPRIVRDLVDTVCGGEAVLFTGAGFSNGALDRDGNALPSSEEMRCDLWTMVFGDGDPDDSTLADLYDVALRRQPQALGAYLARRLRVASLRHRHAATWLAMPWQRIYTLNVDDLEVAVQASCRLPRRLHPVSALTAQPAPDPDCVEVVHLNGMAADGPESVTFSTLQYAARLRRHDREYAALAAELENRPVVFAGTTLDEVVLWRHVALHGPHPPRSRSYLVTTTLSRARQALLESIGAVWIPTSIEEVAGWLAPHAR